MKGEMTQSLLARIIIVLIAIGLMLYILFAYVAGTIFNIFLPGDLTTLKQYSTCVLAYCAAGAGSDEVNAVGCLKYEDGRCMLSCAQVEGEIYLEKNVRPTVTEIGGRGAPHYCGPDAALEFEFDGINLGGMVSLRSGQMDRIANSPQWVCKPIKIPFTDIELDSLGIPTVDIQHGGILGAPQNCIILSGKVSPIFPGREGCFLPIEYDESRDDSYHTPLIQYDEPQQIIYPSAIYVDRSFTTVLKGERQPECEFKEPPQSQIPSKEEIVDKVNELSNIDTGDNAPEQKDAKFEKSLMGNEITRCNFKVRQGNEEIKYKVWAKPVYPTIDALKDFAKIGDLQNFIAGLLGAASPDLQNAFLYVTEAGEEGTKLIFSQLGGSCTAVVLGRDLKEDSLLAEGVGKDEQMSNVLELMTDKTTYSAGDTVKVTGTIENPNDSGKLEVEMTRVDIGVLIPVDATLNNEGSFGFEYRIPEGLRGISGPARYKIIATYEGSEKEIEFTVE